MTREMKNSGVEWIGDIPSEWKIRKIKNVCSIYTGNSIKDNEKNNFTDSTNAIPYIATKEIDVLSSKINYDNGMYIKRDNENFKVAPKNSTLMCIEGGSAGKKIAYLNQDVCFVNKLCCFSTKSLDNKFLYYYLKSPSFKSEFELHISGLIGGVSQGELREFAIPAPPLHEQKRIADFLDSKVTEIDKIISETKASIENYKEYKQSVITEAVTKGLDKNVVRKNCNIQWINEIPKHWSEKKILHITSMPVIDGPHVSPALYDDGIPYISADAIENGKINFDRKRGYISKEYSEECNKRYKPRENDILVVKLGASTGKMAIVGKETNFNIWVPLAVVRCKDNISPKFVFYCMTSQYFKNEIENGWTFGTQETLGVKTLEQLKICIPDSLQEQQEIVDFLDGRCVEIDYLILEKEKLITNLEEYKKSLIYEYVTGKKAVE